MAPDSCPLNGFSCIKPVIMGAFDHKWKPEIPSGFWVRGNLSSPPPSNHTRPSAQDMENVQNFAVQNLVSWLILSVVLSDAPWFHQQEGRKADISSLAPQSASLAPEQTQGHLCLDSWAKVNQWLHESSISESEKKKIWNQKCIQMASLVTNSVFPVLIYPK